MKNLVLAFVILPLLYCVSVQSSYTPDPCSQDSDSGNCYGYFERYFFNYTSGKCETFVYGGCGGNRNNFKTKKACKSACPSTVYLSCPTSKKLFTGFQSDDYFFNGTVTPKCSDSNNCPLSVNTSTSTSVAAVNRQTNLTAECTYNRQYIQTLSIGRSNGHPNSISITCCDLSKLATAHGTFYVNSDDSNNKELDCGDGNVMKRIKLMDPGNGGSVRAVAYCAHLPV